MVLEIVPVLMTYWQTIENKARRFVFFSLQLPTLISIKHK